MQVTGNSNLQYDRPSSLITFYKLDCPKCGTITVGEAVVGDPNWNLDGSVACGKSEGDYCDYIGVPETRKVDLAL